MMGISEAAMRRFVPFLPLLALAACKPPASDDYVARIPIEERDAPADPIQSPDTEDAAWVLGQPRDGAVERIIYGNPGERPLMALSCRDDEDGTHVGFERLIRADPRAQAVLALIGNSHVTRLFVDSTKVGDAWIWRGAVPADEPGLDALTGGRSVEATVPGAGSVVLNASPLPGELIDRCRERLRAKERAPDRAEPAA
ncbi:MAG: hypothetical protein MK010_04910 [Erythrobacter sp.]|nr:hypothetical protein [Erythrobacter sp.]